MSPERQPPKPAAQVPLPAALSEPAPDWQGQTTVNLDDAAAASAPASGEALTPDERDQQPSSQAPDAGQDRTPEARRAYEDARQGRPDTSAPPQLQQPSPGD